MTLITALTRSLAALWGRSAVVIATPGPNPDQAVPVGQANPLPVGLHIYRAGAWLPWDGYASSAPASTPTPPASTTPTLTLDQPPVGWLLQSGTDQSTSSFPTIAGRSYTVTVDWQGITGTLAVEYAYRGGWRTQDSIVGPTNSLTFITNGAGEYRLTKSPVSTQGGAIRVSVAAVPQ